MNYIGGYKMKQNILKHTFAAGLAVLCVAAYAPAVGNTGLFNTAVTASAETLTDGNYEYTLLNNGTVEITKYIGEDTKLTIPSNIGGKADSSSKAAAAATTSNPATGAAAAGVGALALAAAALIVAKKKDE